MGSILVIIGLTIWLVVMAAAVLAPLFAGAERPAVTSFNPESPEAKRQRRSSPTPVRIRRKDQIAA